MLFDGDPLPQHASADYRIGDLDGITFGLKYGWLTAGDSEWSVRAEFYQQTGRAPPGASVGALAALDLDTSVDAVIFQVGYRF